MTGLSVSPVADQRCQLSGTLDFQTATDALEAVAQLIRTHPSLTVSLQGITHSNSAGLALMIEWLAIGRREGHSVTFDHIPDSLRQLAGVCQVDGLI